MLENSRGVTFDFQKDGALKYFHPNHGIRFLEYKVFRAEQQISITMQYTRLQYEVIDCNHVRLTENHLPMGYKLVLTCERDSLIH